MAKNLIKSNLKAIVQNTQSSNIRMIHIDELHSSPNNFYEINHIPEFAATILGQGGVKDNLLVTPLESGGYEIISGHRRAAAVRYLLDQGETISPLLPCLVQSYENEDDKQLDLIFMNVTTRLLSDQELWHSYETLTDIVKRRKDAGEKFGRIRELLADLLNVSPAQVSKMQNVTHNAIEPVKDAVASGELSIHAANEIAKLPEKQQKELAAGDLSKVQPKDVKKKKDAAGSKSKKTTKNAKSGSADPVATSSNFTFAFDARKTELLSAALTTYLSECKASRTVKKELREILKELDTAIEHEKEA